MFLYPHTDLNQQNFDWIIKTLKELQERITTDSIVTVVDLAANMIDKQKIYVYIGSELGMHNNGWYYWDSGTNAWEYGGQWGLEAGLLPISIANGGTGATTKAGARTSLDITPSNINAAPTSWFAGGLSIARGGTGATNVADVKTNLGIVTPVDYIVEKSSSGGWEIVKYASGTCELFGTFSQSISGWSQWSSTVQAWYTNDTLIPPAYPVSFASIPFCYESVFSSGTSAYSYHSTDGTLTVGDGFKLMRPAAGSAGGSIVGEYFVRGVLAP